MSNPAQNKTPLRIPVRRMDFAIPAMARYWYNGNPWITHFLNGMSAVFPDGERFFIHAVRHFESQITDPVLQQQIRAFIGQEANHGKEHEAFNNAMAAQHRGVPLDKMMRGARHGLEWIKKKASPRRQLAMTVGFEHFTAILAHQLLERPDFVREVGGIYADLFLWHAVEETEHKAVAFDVYQAVDGGYWMRVSTMAGVSAMFVTAQLYLMYLLVKSDGKLNDWRAALGFASFILHKPGLFTRIIPQYLDFYRPGFHPWQHDNRALVSERIEQLAEYELQVVKVA